LEAIKVVTLIQKLLLLFNRKNNFCSGLVQSTPIEECLGVPRAVVKKQSRKGKISGKRTRNIYDPLSVEPFKVSRSKLDLFVRCNRCFYIDRKFGVKQPPSYPYSLNNAVDALLKREFDSYRALQKPHPYCTENNLELVPFKHADIDKWRNSLHAGIQYLVPNTNIMLYGGLDDVWLDLRTKELVVVDYKATSKEGEISLDAEWQLGFKRQAEIYQWLLRKNDFVVSNTAYFVYCNGKSDAGTFDKCLKFDVVLLPYHGDDSWVEQTIIKAYECLRSDDIPAFTATCDLCSYSQAVSQYSSNALNPEDDHSNVK